MIDRDLELLGVVKHLTDSMPAMVLHLLDDMRDGTLPADKLRELAGIARDLGDALHTRANEIVAPSAPLVIEEAPEHRPTVRNPSRPVEIESPELFTAIEVGGADFRFCAAHTGLHGGEFEPLHGHTYVPVVRLTGAPAADGMVVDFRTVKAAIREVVAPLRSKTLLAGQAGISLVQHHHAVHMTGTGKRYVFPADDVVVLPIANTTTEELAAYLLRQLVPKLGAVCRVELTLSESPGTSATVIADLAGAQE